MLSGNVDRLLALGIILTLVCTGVSAQQKVYKWVDKDGVTHFSDAPPDESERVEAETLTTKPAPTAVFSKSAMTVRVSPAVRWSACSPKRCSESWKSCGSM